MTYRAPALAQPRSSRAAWPQAPAVRSGGRPAAIELAAGARKATEPRGSPLGQRCFPWQHHNPKPKPARRGEAGAGCAACGRHPHRVAAPSGRPLAASPDSSLPRISISGHRAAQLGSVRNNPVRRETRCGFRGHQPLHTTRSAAAELRNDRRGTGSLFPVKAPGASEPRPGEEEHRECVQQSCRFRNPRTPKAPQP